MKPETNKLKIWYISATLVAIVITAIVIMYSSKETVISIKDKNLVIEDGYGETFQLSDISSVNLLDTIPTIRYRSNGYALGSTKKGYFKTVDGETIKLFVHSSNGPYIEMQKKDGSRVFINFDDPEQTKQIYTQITASIQ